MKVHCNALFAASVQGQGGSGTRKGLGEGGGGEDEGKKEGF